MGQRATASIESLIRRGAPPDEALVTGVTRADSARLGAAGVRRAQDRLASEVLGLGPLDGCLADEAVTDVLLNGDGSVWVDRGDGLHRVDDPEVAVLTDPGTARRLAVRLATLCGRRLDESQPWVDGLLPGGIRLHAVLPPLVDAGVHLSLRVPRVAAVGLDDLGARGMVGPEVHEVLTRVVGGRVGFVVTGGTGSGKTTLLAAMLTLVPAHERIVVVEDVRELGIRHPHVVRLQGRTANVEGRGAVGLVDLVRQALRMRPDRLVVGEVRGAEVRELLAALNTGHEGGCGTLHANSVHDVPTRFEALGALAGLTRDALHAQLASAVRVVVHLERSTRGRAVRAIGVLVGSPSGLVTCQVALDAATGERGPGWEPLARLVGP